MARSIHDTWGELHRAEHSDWSDPEARDAVVAELKANIRRQDAVRTSERRLRREGPADPQPMDVDRLPILIEDEAPFVFHALGAEDIREVIRWLPAGSVDGLRAIRLMVSRDTGERSWPREPFTGRRRFEALPGVYISRTLGWYKPSTATVCVHAFLCERQAVAPFVIWLRLTALRTLLHELAHHFDLTFRVGRSRWDLLDRDKEEAWADRLGGEDNDVLARRYLRDHYPDECERLQTWFQTALGVELPPVMVFLDSDELGLSHAFRRLAREVHAGVDLVAARVRFARQAHRAGVNEVASAIVQAVLAGDPAHPRALALKGCLALCCERDYAGCLASCGRALEGEPDCAEALETVVRCHATAEHWQETAEACERALQHLAVDERSCSPYVLRTLVESRMLLDDADGVRSALAQMRARPMRTLALEADVYEVIERCWREAWEEAFVRASRMLATARGDRWGERALTAVRFECARRLGRSVPDLDVSIVDRFESHPFTRAWATRLRRVAGGSGT
ncbi:MAG TPA: hypothetical protein VIW26_06920 [Gemmatimonadales bacterium]|jgi:hypothetical protein